MPETPPPNDALARIDTPWFRLFHDFLYLPYHLTFTLGYSLRMQGGHNMPKSGPALVIANHQSFLDPPVIGLCARRPLVYLARKTLFNNPYFAFIIRTMNAVPIDQDGVGKDGIRIVLNQLQLGKAVVIFPEGARTEDGVMHPFKPGIHLLIKRAQCPIVPVGIAGAYDAWPIWRPYPVAAPLFLPAQKAAISIAMGKPVDSRRYAELPREQALQELFDLIAVEQQRAEKLRRRM